VNERVIQPVVVVERDYDGFFEALVRSWIREHKGPFHHDTIVICSGPYRMDAVSYASLDGTLALDFYSALRMGFGALSSQDVAELVKML
jgi:hypothetical protein